MPVQFWIIAEGNLAYNLATNFSWGLYGEQICIGSGPVSGFVRDNGGGSQVWSGARGADQCPEHQSGYGAAIGAGTLEGSPGKAAQGKYRGCAEDPLSGNRVE